MHVEGDDENSSESEGIMKSHQINAKKVSLWCQLNQNQKYQNKNQSNFLSPTNIFFCPLFLF